MAEPYLAELQIIVERACAPSAKAMDISCRHFFAGAAAYVGDRIFMTLTPVGLALKRRTSTATRSSIKSRSRYDIFPMRR